MNAHEEHEVFVVADAHGRLDLIEGLLKHAGAERGPGRTIVQLGDLANCVASSIADDLAVLEAAPDLFDVLLVGNHEYPYLGGDRFAGFWRDPEVESAIRRLDWKPAYAHGDYLVTHAGLASMWALPPTYGSTAQQNARLLCQAWAHNRRHTYFSQVGRERGGQADHGGILWADWSEEKSTDGFSQIVGHTPGPIRARAGDVEYRDEHEQTCRWLPPLALCIDLGASKGGKDYADPNSTKTWPRVDALAGCWIRGDEVKVVVWRSQT